MSAAPYSIAALREFRQRKTEAASVALLSAPVTLAGIPPEAPMQEGILLGCWNGERFVSWREWRTSTPFEVEQALAKPDIPLDATRVTAVCGTTPVRLVRDGERWLMYVGSRRESSRMLDFASPSLAHARQTAVVWYGPAIDGWHEER